MGPKDRVTNKVVAGPVESTAKERREGFMEGVTDEGTEVYADKAAV